MNGKSRLLAARWIIPVSRDPINGGWMRIENGRIAAVESGRPPAEAEDLGDVALLPGLINAHTHLEFSDCQTPIGQQGIPLYEWIGQVVAARGQTSPESKRQAVAAGLKELRDTGTRLAGEITTPPCDYWRHDPPPELVTFAEVLGLEPARSDERLAAAAQHNDSHPNGGWSPHAPYSTSLETIRSCVKCARRHDRPLAIHVAESAAERELLSVGTGPFAELLVAMGVWRDGLFPWGSDPLATLIDCLADAPRVLIVHGNDLNENEIDRLSSHPNMTVVYCPRTHHQFLPQHRHPVDRLLAAGVSVALGTDSRASNPDLKLWGEVQFLLNNRTDLSPAQVLRMATLGGAEAFGRSDLGRLEVGCRPGLGRLPTSATTVDAMYADLSENEYVRVG